MKTDAWGHGLTTDSDDAAIALGEAVDAFIEWRTDAMALVNAAIEADADFALAYAFKGIFMAGLRKLEIQGALQTNLEKARGARRPETEREARYIAALDAVVRGHVTVAVAEYEAIARAHPLDLVSLRLAQMELFWIGEVEWMCDISNRAAPAWSPGVRSFNRFQSIRAFSLEETGDYINAESCGREAVDLDPSDCWGAHAVAHVMTMQGRLDEGIAFVSALTDNWERANHIRHHNWWHLALFHAERGDYAAAVDIYDGRLRDLDSPLMQALPDFYVDIQNDVAILQRLELRGVDVGDRWTPVAELARGRRGNFSSPFTSAHCALAFAAAGWDVDAEECVRSMREFIAEDGGPMAARYALATLPATVAAIAHRKGKHELVIETMGPARRNLWQMGGSHAQRDLFYQLYADSARRLGRRDVLEILFDDLNSIGLEHLSERSSYADAFAILQ